MSLNGASPPRGGGWEDTVRVLRRVLFLKIWTLSSPLNDHRDHHHCHWRGFSLAPLVVVLLLPPPLVGAITVSSPVSLSIASHKHGSGFTEEQCYRPDRSVAGEYLSHIALNVPFYSNRIDR